jgi:hypothetical protein
MERTKINSQSRFGPAEARASVFSAFEQARTNTTASQDAENLAEIAAAGATYFADEEIAQAESDLENGIVAGIINDGEAIRNGELEPSESIHFQRGVELGRTRAIGLQMGIELNQRRRQAELEGTLPTDAGDAAAWRRETLAEIQQEFGIDPANMTGAVGREYASALMQVRQQDGAAHAEYANRRLMEDAYEAFDIELSSIWQEGADLDEAVQQTSALIASRRATGLDGTQLKTRAYNAVRGEAQRTSNPELLEQYIEASDSVQPPLLSEAQEAALRGEAASMRRTLRQEARNAQVDAEREQKRREDAALQDAALELYVDPYAPLPPSIAQLGDTAVNRWNSLRSSFQSVRENGVDPRVEALTLEQITNASFLPGQADAAREALITAAINEEISPGSFVTTLSQIEDNARAVNFLQHPQVKDIRDSLDRRSMFSFLEGPQADENRAVLRGFDVQFSSLLSEWVQNNPSQHPTPMVLGSLADQAAETVNNRFQRTIGAPNPQEARRVLLGDQAASPQNEPEDTLPAPIPGGP